MIRGGERLENCCCRSGTEDPPARRALSSSTGQDRRWTAQAEAGKCGVGPGQLQEADLAASHTQFGRTVLDLAREEGIDLMAMKEAVAEQVPRGEG